MSLYFVHDALTTFQRCFPGGGQLVSVAPVGPGEKRLAINWVVYYEKTKQRKEQRS